MALSWVGATVPDVARPDVTSCCGSQHIVTALQLSRALTREKALSQVSAHVREAGGGLWSREELGA
jgi:hypothetical protein